MPSVNRHADYAYELDLGVHGEISRVSVRMSREEAETLLDLLRTALNPPMTEDEKRAATEKQAALVKRVKAESREELLRSRDPLEDDEEDDL